MSKVSLSSLMHARGSQTPIISLKDMDFGIFSEQNQFYVVGFILLKDYSARLCYRRSSNNITQRGNSCEYSQSNRI